MSEENGSAATGGLLVILGILLVLGVGFFLYKQGMLGGHSGPEIKVELPSK